tara:strand:+ start:102 stop:542 length:441 start_codon:yes stop_codon:yes gene_type:complete
MINLSKYLDEILNINYAISKFDVPYMPINFPEKYPIGKDLDILVSSNDFKEIQEITTKYFMKYSGQFITKIMKEGNDRFFLRIMNKNYNLHYMIDITINDKLIQNRVKKYNYFILSLENEKKVRLMEVRENPNKLYHREWLIKNKK